MIEIYISIDDHDLVINVEACANGVRMSEAHHYPVANIPVGVSAWLNVLDKK